MTLIPYDAERLDQLALRLLDLAAVLRRMGSTSRDHELDQYKMHDKKALEWLSQLEEWAQRGAGDMEVEVVRQKARRRADGTNPEKPATRSKKSS
jgi:hypothetical protein